jgi:uncharacterized DUF497 family protein
MRVINWNKEKNEQLVKNRGIGFKTAAQMIENGRVMSIIDNPNQIKYAGQRMYVLNINNYAWLVPFVENGNVIFLKTMIPSRAATKKFLRGGN